VCVCVFVCVCLVAFICLSCIFYYVSAVLANKRTYNRDYAVFGPVRDFGISCCNLLLV